MMEWNENLLDKLDRFSKQKCAREVLEPKNGYAISAVLKKVSGKDPK